MKLLDANLKIILDSRGEETLEAELKSDEFSASASVPSGKSRGTHEAFVLEPKLALQKFESIKPQILSREFESQEEFDNFLISLDATPNKQNLGGNLILALSLAFARLKAKSEEKELFQYINQLLRGLTSSRIDNNIWEVEPRPIFNVINGGTHANNNLNFQEFQIIPAVSDFGMALGLGQEFYRKLKEFLEKKFDKENVSLGDEAGFSAAFKNNEETIEILAELIAKYNYPLRIGLDIAASQFYKDGYYLVNNKKYSSDELFDYYQKLIKAYNILSIEDPFNEEAFDDFAKLTAQLQEVRPPVVAEGESPEGLISRQYLGCRTSQILIITDDLTTTNPERLKIAIEKKAGNVILIKPNQIGTLTETLNVVKSAYENDWQAIVSHRSGETMDDFIADLAIGIAAWGIKAGAPAAPERMAKYQRILFLNQRF